MCNAAEKRYKKAIGKTVFTWLDTVKGGLTGEVIPELNEELFGITSSLVAGALLLGYGHAQEKEEFADSTEPIAFEQALQFLQSKIPMTKKEWLNLEPKLRFRSFTVARLAELDYIEAVRGRLTHAVKEGKTWAGAWQDVKAIAEAEGSAIRPGYWETVYRTNVQSAYNAGRLMQYQNNPPEAWQLLVIEDPRTSGICRGLAAIFRGNNALPANHNFWKTYGYPPYHFNCRTIVRAVHKQEIGRGTAVENIPMKTIRKQFRPQAGFGGNPLEKESWWKITPEMIARADKYGITADIVVQARELDMQSYFPELLKGYKTEYKAKGGGYVQKAVNWEYRETELSAAKRLAAAGHKVYLLPRSDLAPSPDMIIDNEIGEMKHIHTDTRRTIREHIRKAGGKQRARTLYIQVQTQKQKDRLFEIMTEEIVNLPTQTLLLNFNGSITKYSRNFFFK